MFVEFNQMPGDARVWIYQSDRTFSDDDVKAITGESINFLTQWTAHGAKLKSSAKVFYNRFLVVALDEKEAQASGCSIDSCVHFVQSLGKTLDVDFFERTKVAFLINDQVVIESLESIKNNTTTRAIAGDSLNFNNLVQSKSEFDSQWITPVSESWLGKYFKTQKV